MLWNLNGLDKWHQEMNHLFDRMLRAEYTGDFPPVNLYHGEEAVAITAAIPGLDPEALEVVAKERVITIKGQRPKLELEEGERLLRQERMSGQFERSFTLPYVVDPELIDAEYKHGILTVKVPRPESAKARRIPVSVN